MMRNTRISFLNAAASHEARTESFRLLLVDSDPADRTRLAGALRRGGHDVRETSSGPEAEALAESYEPDGILVDLTTPSHGELRMLKALMGEQLWSGVPVIVFTRKHTDAALLRRAQTPARSEGRVLPPPELDTVLAAIRRCGRNGSP